MTTMTKTKERPWSEALAAELKQEATAAREARAEVRKSAATTRRALAAAITGWWSTFVAELRGAVEVLRGEVPGLHDLALVERAPGSAMVQCATGSIHVDIDAEGDLRIRRLVLGSGGTTFVTLTPSPDGITPAPAVLARELLTPFARDVGAWARRTDR